MYSASACDRRFLAAPFRSALSGDNRLEESNGSSFLARTMGPAGAIGFVSAAVGRKYSLLVPSAVVGVVVTGAAVLFSAVGRREASSSAERSIIFMRSRYFSASGDCFWASKLRM